MCKIIAVINKKGSNKGLINKILESNISDLSRERSGYSIFSKGETKDYPGDKAYEYDNLKSNVVYEGGDMFIVHFRTATCGSRDVEGLHLKAINDRYVYAHNGTVELFNTVSKNNDSFYFFRRLVTLEKEITADIVNAYINTCGFWGKGLLFDKETNEMYFFNNQPAWINVFDDCIILSSYDLNLKVKKFKEHEVLGYKWKQFVEEEEIPTLHSQKFDNTYLKFKDGVLIEQSKAVNATTNINSQSSIMPIEEEEVDALFKNFQEKEKNEIL